MPLTLVCGVVASKPSRRASGSLLLILTKELFSGDIISLSPNGQLLVGVVVGPVAGPQSLVHRNLDVLLPDAPALAHLDHILALLSTQQVRDDKALNDCVLLSSKDHFLMTNLAVQDCDDGVAGEGVEGLGGGLLHTRKVLLPQPMLVILAEAGEVYLDAGLDVLLGGVVGPGREKDLAVLGKRVIEVIDPLEVVRHVSFRRHLESCRGLGF